MPAVSSWIKPPSNSVTTPLIFTGLAVAVAFRCGLLNIGAEGQLYVAAFAAAWVGFKFGAPAPDNTVISQIAHLPAILLVPMCCVAAIVAGAIWGGSGIAKHSRTVCG